MRLGSELSAALPEANEAVWIRALLVDAAGF